MVGVFTEIQDSIHYKWIIQCNCFFRDRMNRGRKGVDYLTATYNIHSTSYSSPSSYSSHTPSYSSHINSYTSKGSLYPYHGSTYSSNENLRSTTNNVYTRIPQVATSSYLDHFTKNMDSDSSKPFSRPSLGTRGCYHKAVNWNTKRGETVVKNFKVGLVWLHTGCFSNCSSRFFVPTWKKLYKEEILMFWCQIHWELKRAG